MTNRYANLDPYAPIRTDFGKITEGFEKVQQEMDEQIAAVESQESRIDNIVIQSGDDITEIVDARQPASGEAFPVLKSRLDATDTQLAEKAEKTYVDNKLTDIDLGYGVNIEDFGARTELEDNTPFIQAAIDYCFTNNKFPLIVPPGVFNCANGLTFGNGQGEKVDRIIGYGILAAANAQNPITLLTTNCRGNFKVTLTSNERLPWIAGRKPSHHNGLRVVGAGNVLLKECRLEFFDRGVIYENEGGHIWAENCEFENNYVGVDIKKARGDYYFSGGNINGNNYCNVLLSHDENPNHSSFSFRNLHCGFSPYGILQKKKQNNGESFLIAANFEQCQFESVGNAAMWSPVGTVAGNLHFVNCGYGWDWSGSNNQYTMTQTAYPNTTNPDGDDFNPATPREYFFTFNRITHEIVFSGRMQMGHYSSFSRMFHVREKSNGKLVLHSLDERMFSDHMSTFLDQQFLQLNIASRWRDININDGSDGGTTEREFWVNDNLIKSGMVPNSFFVRRYHLPGYVDDLKVELLRQTTGQRFPEVQDGRFKIKISFDGDTGQAIQGWFSLQYSLN